MAARQGGIRLPAKAKACDVCAKAALRISTLHRHCLHDLHALHTGLLASIWAVKLIRHGALPDISEPPQPKLVACLAHAIQNFLPGTAVAIVGVIWRMARPRATPGTECEAVRCGRAGCVAVEGKPGCVAKSK